MASGCQLHYNLSQTGCHVEPMYRSSSTRKPDKTEEEEAQDPCPYCSNEVPQTKLDCPECKNTIPYCIITGRHMVKDNWTVCPNCSFPALHSELMSLLESGETLCPMCSQSIAATEVKVIKDPSEYLKTGSKD